MSGNHRLSFTQQAKASKAYIELTFSIHKSKTSEDLRRLVYVYNVLSKIWIHKLESYKTESQMASNEHVLLVSSRS